MVVHVAIFKWKDGVKPEEVASAIKQVRKLKEKVPGIIDIRGGKNFSRWNKGYTHAFLVLAENKEALEAYRNHPDHKKVAEKIEEMDAGSIGIDFED